MINRFGWNVLAALVATSAVAQPDSTRHPAIAFDIRVSGGPVSGMSSGMAAVASASRSYAGRAVFVGNRGRLDVTEGGIDPLFSAGDYMLFDSGTVTIVHPAAKEYVVITPEMMSRQFDAMRAMGVSISLADLKVVMDSLAGTDTVAGHATRHFRMTTAFTMSIEAAGLPAQRLATEGITDYWVANVPGMPANPLLRANALGMDRGPSSLFKELSSKVDSAAARLGTAAALRTHTTTRLIQGPGMVVTTENTSDVANIRPVTVGAGMFSIPATFKKGELPF